MTRDSSRNRLIKAASYASLGTAFGLVLLKIWAWQMTDSVALLSSLVDSLLDVCASALTFVAVRMAMEPADEEHRFGHGKWEGLAALAQAFIIAASATFVLYQAILRLGSDAQLQSPELGMGTMLISLVASGLLVMFQRSVARRTGSLAIAADAQHYRADILVNLGVLISLPLSAWAGLPWLDPITGIAVALYILAGTWELARNSLDVLLDHEIPESERQEILTIAHDHPDVSGVHDLRTRSTGTNYVLQFHIEVDGETPLHRVHEIMDSIEDRLYARFENCEIILHADPSGLHEKRDNFSQN